MHVLSIALAFRIKLSFGLSLEREVTGGKRKRRKRSDRGKETSILTKRKQMKTFLIVELPTLRIVDNSGKI